MYQFVQLRMVSARHGLLELIPVSFVFGKIDAKYGVCSTVVLLDLSVILVVELRGSRA